MTMSDTPTTSHISVIVPVGERHSDLTQLYADYRAGVAVLGGEYEFIFVLDGPQPDFSAGLKRLQQAGEPVIIIQLTRPFGEATALMAGFERARGETVITLPAYFQIEGRDIGKLVGALAEADMVIGHRWPRSGSWFERLRRSAFHGLLARVTRLRFNDLGCGARALKRHVLEEISLYGDQHRFLAVLADRQGFRVREVTVTQATQDKYSGVYGPRHYARGFLDIFTVFFLVRFTKKPLRFFGMVGISTFAIGVIFLIWLIIDRFYFGQALADRPALLLSSLLVVLGLQVFALGLLGELIIFTHARALKDYQIAEVIQFPSANRRSSAQDSLPPQGDLLAQHTQP